MPQRCSHLDQVQAGDPLGDLMFNLGFAALLRRVHRRMAEEGLVALLPVSSAVDTSAGLLGGGHLVARGGAIWSFLSVR